MRKNNQSSKPLSNGGVLALTGVCLTVGAAVSVLLLVNSIQNSHGQDVLWLGWLSVTLICGSSLFLALALAHVFDSRTRESWHDFPGSATLMNLMIAFNAYHRSREPSRSFFPTDVHSSFTQV